MTSISPRRTLTVALLLACLALAAVPVHASPLSLDRSEKLVADESLLLTLWGFVAGLLDKAGMTIDPNGKPEDVGMTIDPDGEPEPGEEGMSIDPNG